MKNIFEEHQNDARKFVKEVAIELQKPEDLQGAIRKMTAIFHTIRDMITVQESLHLISQLPLYVKGLYVSDWHLGEKKKIKDKNEFVNQLVSQNARTGVGDFGTDEIAMVNVKAVVRVLQNHISQGQIDDLVAQFPKELKDIWQHQEIHLTDHNIH
jgi:uncharacterized protein (DUF2267 family)